VYASGKAIAINSSRKGGGTTLAVFFPPRYIHELRAGQRLLLQPAQPGQHLEGKIVSVKPRVLRPDTARRQLGLRGAAARSVSRSVAVAIASTGPLPATMAASGRSSYVYRTRVEVGSRKVTTLLASGERLAGGAQ
jgi:hypothetical protein